MKFWEALRDEGNTRVLQTVMAFLIFVTTVVIAWIYVGQLNQMTESNRLTREQFRLDQRPYIWLGSNLGSPVLFHDGKNSSDYVAWGPWHYQNYGKAPADNAVMNQQLLFGNDALKQPRVFTGKEKPIAPLPPGKDDMSSSISSQKVSATEFQHLMDTDNAIVVFGYFSYTDASGKPYRSDFCFAHLRLGPTIYCPDAKDNFIK